MVACQSHKLNVVGSSPTSAIIRSVRLGVRTSGFHPDNMGSIPVLTENWESRIEAIAVDCKFTPFGFNGSIPFFPRKIEYSLSCSARTLLRLHSSDGRAIGC